jgi:hypothetical protein
MSYVIISPYSQKLPDKENPKNYPYWQEFIELFKKKYPDISILQIGLSSEINLCGVNYLFDAPFSELKEQVKKSLCWFSVDNFFQHFCHYNKLIPGIVVWGQSDPKIFGYEENINLLKGREYLREKQFDWWNFATYKKEAFVEPKILIRAFEMHLSKNRNYINKENK